MRAAIGLFTLCRAVAGLSAQDTVSAAATSVKDPVYICPMDPNMRSNTTDKRPKCVMAMVAAIGDSAEFHVHLSASPNPVKPGTRKRIAFDFRPIEGSSRFEIPGDPRKAFPRIPFRLQAANNFPLGAQYDSILGTRSADDHHGIGI